MTEKKMTEEKERKEPTCFTVSSKDLSDPDKNPNLSLSAKDILNNPNIPKRYLSGDKQ